MRKQYSVQIHLTTSRPLYSNKKTSQTGVIEAISAILPRKNQAAHNQARGQHAHQGGWQIEDQQGRGDKKVGEKGQGARAVGSDTSIASGGWSRARGRGVGIRSPSIRRTSKRAGRRWRRQEGRTRRSWRVLKGTMTVTPSVCIVLYG